MCRNMFHILAAAFRTHRTDFVSFTNYRSYYFTSLFVVVAIHKDTYSDLTASRVNVFFMLTRSYTIICQCPYLSPTPFRGKRNDSTHVYRVAEKIAEVKGMDPEEVARITMENGKRFFRIAE